MNEEFENLDLHSQDAEDDEVFEWNQDFFPFQSDEKWIIDELAKVLREILRDRELPGKDIRRIGIMLSAIAALPVRTKGLDMMLTIVYRLNNESNACSFHLSESAFSLQSGGNVYDPAVGSDSFGAIVFEAETSGYRDPESLDMFSEESFALTGWFNGIRELLAMDAQIEIDFCEDENDVELIDNPNNDAWNELEKIWENYNR